MLLTSRYCLPPIAVFQCRNMERLSYIRSGEAASWTPRESHPPVLPSMKKATPSFSLCPTLLFCEPANRSSTPWLNLRLFGTLLSRNLQSHSPRPIIINPWLHPSTTASAQDQILRHHRPSGQVPNHVLLLPPCQDERGNSYRRLWRNARIAPAAGGWPLVRGPHLGLVIALNTGPPLMLAILAYLLKISQSR